MSKIGRRLRKDKLVKRGSRAVTDLHKLASSIRADKKKLDELYQVVPGPDPQMNHGRAAYFIPSLYRNSSIPCPWLDLATIKARLGSLSGTALRDFLENVVKNWEQGQAAGLGSRLATTVQERDRYKDELHILRISNQSSVSVTYHTSALKKLETQLGQAVRLRDAAVDQLANLKMRYDQATNNLSRAVSVDRPHPAAVPVDLRRAGQAAVPVDQSCRAAVPVDVAKTLKDRDNELAAVKKQLEQAKRELQSIKNELATSKRNLQEALQANAAINEPFEQAKTRVSELDLEVQMLTNARVQLEQDLQASQSEVNQLTLNVDTRQSELVRSAANYHKLVEQCGTVTINLAESEQECTDLRAIVAVLDEAGVTTSSAAMTKRDLQHLKDTEHQLKGINDELKHTKEELKDTKDELKATKDELNQLQVEHQKLSEKDNAMVIDAPHAEPEAPVIDLASTAPEYQDEHLTPDSTYYALVEIAKDMAQGPGQFKRGIKRLTKLADTAPDLIIDAKTQKNIGLGGIEHYVYETAAHHSYHKDGELGPLIFQMGHALRIRDHRLRPAAKSSDSDEDSDDDDDEDDSDGNESENDNDNDN
ncbi:hypothetical protein HD553DRAFT_342980 [Filobasidium floriforme]|uniref:uncharacterized protein n=1 Tax=Filobasidium floriforme TaxID=5210 RepID=UPI001E8E9394|nr:uncharacterized protein HD553DRAFT_342980 [Filobasidium floriforme]KAH8082998.1 hypothetical protein HD553DRAFT_342980 [Filobasidium floriforme]